MAPHPPPPGQADDALADLKQAIEALAPGEGVLEGP